MKNCYSEKLKSNFSSSCKNHWDISKRWKIIFFLFMFSFFKWPSSTQFSSLFFFSSSSNLSWLQSFPFSIPLNWSFFSSPFSLVPFHQTHFLSSFFFFYTFSLFFLAPTLEKPQERQTQRISPSQCNELLLTVFNSNHQQFFSQLK